MFEFFFLKERERSKVWIFLKLNILVQNTTCRWTFWGFLFFFFSFVCDLMDGVGHRVYTRVNNHYVLEHTEAIWYILIITISPGARNHVAKQISIQQVIMKVTCTMKKTPIIWLFLMKFILFSFRYDNLPSTQWTSFEGYQTTMQSLYMYEFKMLWF